MQVATRRWSPSRRRAEHAHNPCSGAAVRVDATKGAAHSSEQHHHADHSCAARRWEKQPAGAQQLGVPWQHDAATATWMDGPDVHTSKYTFTAAICQRLRVFVPDQVQSHVCKRARARQTTPQSVRHRSGRSRYVLIPLTGGSYSCLRCTAVDHTLCPPCARYVALYAPDRGTAYR